MPAHAALLGSSIAVFTAVITPAAATNVHILETVPVPDVVRFMLSFLLLIELGTLTSFV
jgi:hypothetical protein